MTIGIQHLRDTEFINYSLAISSQGDTGTASVITITAKELDGDAIEKVGNLIRVRVCNEGVFADSTNATIAINGGSLLRETMTATKDLVISNVIAAAATETLTISGVVIDGETATIGSQVYEFDTDGSITSGNVSVDISAGATASQGTLTMDTQPTIGDTITVGSRTYSFVAEVGADTDGEIGIGADLAGAKTNVVAAINGTDGWNVANTSASAAAFSGDDSVITALTPGTAGDAIVTTETFTAGTNVFDAATLGTTTAGVDCIAATAVTALVAAIVGDGSAVVGAADGAGDTVDVTADTAGSAGNSIVSTETMANGAFGAATLSGGVDASLSEFKIAVTDATAETVTLRIGPPPVGGTFGDYDASLDLTHAAP